MNGEFVGVTSPITITSIDDVLADDPHGLLDEDVEERDCHDCIDEDDIFDDPVQQEDPAFIGPMPNPEPAYVHLTDGSVFASDPRPEPSTGQLHHEILRETFREHGSNGWNDLVASMRAEDEEWVPNFSGQRFTGERYSDCNFFGADFTDATLDNAVFRFCVMDEAKFDGASMFGASFSYCNVTDSTYRQGISWENASWDTCAGYRAPLPDITEQVARHYLFEQIGQRDSEVNAGLAELRENGVRCEWRGTELHFWFASEVERQVDACEEGECDCETDHACEGCCDCCACYNGNCDCSPDHNYGDLYSTGERFLGTVIGKVTYSWHATRGLQGGLEMNRASCHPHISTDGSLCLGDAIMPRSLVAADFIVMLLGWAPGHNPSDEYRSIHDLPRV